jgi:hypothetical protein
MLKFSTISVPSYSQFSSSKKYIVKNSSAVSRSLKKFKKIKDSPKWEQPQA